MKIKAILTALVLIVSIFLISGCEEQEEGTGFVDPSIAAMKNEPETAPKEVPIRKEPEEMMNPEPEPVMEPEPEPEALTEPEPVDPFCGDGKCDADENCRTCVKDCGCKSPRVCKDDKCIEPACDADSDCADADACTVDKCYFPAHPNAYCGHEDVERCRNSDDCCPRDCNADNDSDCKPDCGNHVCETGETVDDCPKDCEPDAVCGNQECETGENSDSCPEDCGQVY